MTGRDHAGWAGPRPSPHPRKCEELAQTCHSLRCPLLGYGYGLLNDRHEAQSSRPRGASLRAHDDTQFELGYSFE